MIGILKALGADNLSDLKNIPLQCFLFSCKRFVLGNLIGIAILLLQYYFGIIKLNPENYYVNEAPVYFNLVYIVVLNLMTVLVCFLVLLIPSYIITRISPVRAIRYD